MRCGWYKQWRALAFAYPCLRPPCPGTSTTQWYVHRTAMAHLIVDHEALATIVAAPHHGATVEIVVVTSTQGVGNRSVHAYTYTSSTINDVMRYNDA